MKQKLTDLYAKNGTKKVLASLLSLLAGLLLGSIVVIIVGLAEQKITTAGMWEGVRLIFAGILSTGRDAAGALTWGFNAQNVGNMLFRAMPLIMTGLSVAVAFKTGLFNIGAPGQYLMGTLVSLSVALGIPSESVPVGIIWLLAFGRYAGWRPVGCDPRIAEGAAEYQRGAGLHHDQLDRRQSCHLDV